MGAVFGHPRVCNSEGWLSRSVLAGFSCSFASSMLPRERFEKCHVPTLVGLQQCRTPHERKAP